MGTNETHVGGDESLFREINERIRATIADEYTRFLCECADTACVDTIELPLWQYEEVRRVPTHFIVRREHVIDELERVVASGPGYVVVEKFGAAGVFAIAEAPRRSEETRR